MSIIFQALQKLDTSSESEKNPSDSSATQSGSQKEPRNLVFRVALICLGVFFTIGLGYGAVFGVRYITDRVQSTPSHDPIVQKGPSNFHVNEPKKTFNPPKPNFFPEETVQNELQYFPPREGDSPEKTKTFKA